MKASTYYREMAQIVRDIECKKSNCTDLIEDYQKRYKEDHESEYYLEWIEDQKDRYEALDKINRKLVDKG